MSLIIVALFAIALYGQVTRSDDTVGCPREPYQIDAVYNLKGDIYSPGYGKVLYPPRLYCVYNIKAHANYRIKITFKDIDIDPFGMCGKDKLYVFDGPNLQSNVLGIYCGTEAPPPVVSSGNEMTVAFFTDYLKGAKGFHIQYEAFTGDLCPQGYSQCKNNNCYKTTDKCNGKDDCGDGTDEENCNRPIPAYSCGTSVFPPYEAAESYDRIIGGREVRRGSWPWQADMQLKMFYPNGHTCGGTLIHPQWVMSAVHCLMSSGFASGWRIHLGNHHKYTKDDHEQVRFVERIIIYPGYTGDEIIGKPIDITHDVALFKLNAPVDITDYVRPACLPPQGYELKISSVCMATGWGTTRGSGSDDVLKQVDMTVRPGQQCPGFYNETMICLRNEKGFQDVCHGDSGGPLNCKIGNTWNVLGVASFVTSTNMMGGLCAMPKSGAVYNKVSVKTGWIQDMMRMYA